ncbi:hypothetical protein KEJ17_04005 [Candidatus Bathyarchaeota archaeon]|nr:hypothetical protein [Candidatus Bathyarchaeota archaeon]
MNKENLNSESKWIPFEYPWDDAPLDLSFLYEKDRPAGIHGFLMVKGNKFMFEDGTKVRFWGTCFNAAANFPPHELAEKTARRVAKFGINMVRTHQLDAEWSTPNIFQFSKGKPLENTLNFDPKSLDKLDYLIYCLKKEGVYIYLDQLTYRKFKPGDSVDAVDDLGEAAKPYVCFDRRLIELQKKFSYDLWTHINPYTGLAYKDDPAIALMEIVNECDLFTHQVTLEPYRSRLEERYRAWAKEYDIKAGDEKIDFTKPTEPILRFFAEITQNYYKEIIGFLRDIGVRIPITGTNWSQSLGLLYSLTVCDYTDSHCYWGWGKNEPMVGKTDIFGTLSFNRFIDKPFVVSEWDEPWPNEWRAESPLLIAGMAGFQDWSGVILHTYRYCYFGPVDHMGGITMGGGRHRVLFEAPFIDPAKFGLFYHAALLFRRGDVETARKTIGIRITDDIISHPEKSRVTAIKALKTISEKHGIGMVLPRQAPIIDMAISPDDTTLIAQCKNEVVSDTGQLYRNWEKKYGWIDTPYTKAAYGFLGEIGERVLKGMKMSVKTQFATIALSSLTNKPINESSHLLLTAVGRADNTGAKYDAEHTYPTDIGHGPIIIEPIQASIELISINRLRIWSISPEGFYTGTIPVEYKDGMLRFEIGKIWPSMYYILQRA